MFLGLGKQTQHGESRAAQLYYSQVITCIKDFGLIYEDKK